MKKRAAGWAARFAFLLASTGLLSACVTREPFIPAHLPAGAQQGVELDATPFFPQDKYQCGPAALATVLVASNADTTPEALVPVVYLPARKGSLQVEMQAAPRRFGRLSYELSRNLQSILEELAAGRPVLVLHNYGLSFWPRWHYAVVIGYDAATDSFILRSGKKRRQEWRARTFMVAWHNGGRWAMVVLRPGETPASADPTLYLQAAADFERGASPADARLAFDAAVQRWPAQSVAWTGRGTAEYRAGNFAGAARDYAAALRLDPNNIGARNNLAQSLLDLGCPARALEQLQAVDVGALASPLKEAVLDTRRHIEAAVTSTLVLEPSRCSSQF
ncbi:MAG TPA: PA2778 family cysteine peptidase [Steroidobacteraceae bacterium]|nr:PA2778 family cysteine peptidase [Steroidobacteraceae bacterium]